MKPRKELDFEALKRMLPQQVDRLPSPAEFAAVVGRGRSTKLMRVRRRWVGLGWVDEGDADGSEPLLVTDEKSRAAMAAAKAGGRKASGKGKRR